MNTTSFRFFLLSASVSALLAGCGLGDPCAGVTCGDSMQCDPNNGTCVPAGSVSDGGVGTSSGGTRSGSRIRQRVATTPDGARMFMGWHDNSLQVDCFFGTAGDGQTRCLPSNEGRQTLSVQSGYYSDSTCSTAVPVVFMPSTPACALPDYAISSENTCPARVHYYQLGARYTGNLYYKYTTADCGIYGSGTSEVRRVTEVPPSSFQPVTFALE